MYLAWELEFESSSLKAWVGKLSLTDWGTDLGALGKAEDVVAGYSRCLPCSLMLQNLASSCCTLFSDDGSYLLQSIQRVCFNIITRVSAVLSN
jgi:hypothetical protein